MIMEESGRYERGITGKDNCGDEIPQEIKRMEEIMELYSKGLWTFLTFGEDERMVRGV